MHRTHPIPLAKPKTRRSRFTDGLILTMGALVVAGLSVSAFELEKVRAQTASLNTSYETPVTYTPPPEPTTVAFIGDSYTVGSGAGGKTKRWTTLLSREKGWLELNYGIGGTNYSTAGDLAGGKAYSDHLFDLIISDPDIVIVSSAGNGLSTDQTAGIADTFRILKKELPDAEIYATSPYTRAGWYSERIAEFGEDVEAGVEAAGGTYLDLNDPLGEHPDALAEDLVHPDNTGHRIIASAVSEALDRARDSRHSD